jgi:hypothetical protein
MIMAVKRLALASAVAVPGFAAAADLSVTAGAFRFNATDYYFPGFYEEAGYRGGPEAAG